MYADFEADIGNNCSIGNITTIIDKQNTKLKGYHIESEVEGVLKSGYYKSQLGYKNVDWFVNELINLEEKMAFFFLNTNKDIIMTKKVGEDFKSNSICRFCGKKLNLIKLEIIVI